MTIPQLFANELAFWINVNQKFFGVTPIHEEDDYADIQKKLDKDCKKFWNTSNPCKLAKKLNDGTLNKEASKQTKNSYKLVMNFFNMCIDVYGDYDGKSYKICAIPTPCDDLCWIINRTHYVTRITATRDLYGVVSKVDYETILGEGWKYNIRTDDFECSINKEEYKFEPTIEEIFNNHLSYRSRIFLETTLGAPLTIKNFKKALKKIPIFSKDSIFNYKFSRIEYFEDIILNSNHYAQPTKNILLGINTMIASKSKVYTKTGERLEGCLVRSESKIFALENFRTCVNVFSSGNNKNTYGNKTKTASSSFQPAFTYSDTNGFFDSFKTVTSKSAGRQRLLLDNVVLKHGLLWIVDDNGEMHNMYEYMDMPQKKRLSCLSEAPFCNNDKPKRIMMNAKMTSQSVPLKNETDEYTHRIKLRVGFTDIEGYTMADGIVISESASKALRTYNSDILYLSNSSNLYNLLTNKPKFNLETLKMIYPTKNEAILDSYENVHIDHIDAIDGKHSRIFLKWEIPFRLGDKITNLHGAKGTVGLILPDDQMPRLTKKAGNMEAGPLDIIISGFSTIRRGSLGQIFEAWANACDIDYSDDKDYISIMIKKYGKQMKKFSENSIVEFGGEQSVIPVGIINVMRLYHHASTHLSCSSAEFAYKRTLKFGEMEKLNLVANDCPNILKELGIRSVTKYIGSHNLINNMEKDRELPKNTKLSLQFAEILKSMGYDIIVDGKNLITTDYMNVDDIDISNINMIIKGEISDEDAD